MDTWEYFTTTLVTNTELTPVPVTDDIPLGTYPRYSVYTLIPQLNKFGSKGWELISLEPVQVGSKGDIRICDSSSGQWTYTYFATMKRRTTVEL